MKNMLMTLMLCGLSFCVVSAATSAATAGENSEETGNLEQVSYHKQILPLFQANCSGCHQPAKASGGFVMTNVKRLFAKGDSGLAGVVPGNAEESYLVELITPENGKAEMPKGKAPLSGDEIKLIRKWIAEGAKDDTPENTSQVYDQDHPPVYTRPPVITSLDYSPDGKIIAIAGYHEVLLVDSESGKLTGRLVGLSERVESVQFSPDGKSLAVTGGLPGRSGELQVWDVATKKLTLSLPVTHDTIYGGKWSADGKLISFGCSDNTVRAVNAKTGEQVLFQGAHSDWVRDTVFNKDGTFLVSVARDMTVKLTEVATQRFVDNITSITPGALKGGVQAVTRHPERDEVVIGGSDGVVKIYRMERITKRVIGDDANLIRKMPPLKGRIFSVDVTPDGKQIVAGSSIDGSGEVAVYSYDFSGELPANIKKLNETRNLNPEQKKELEAFHTKNAKTISQTSIPEASIYAVAFHPDGKQFVAAGGDGAIRVIESATGKIVRTFSPAPVTPEQSVANTEEMQRSMSKGSTLKPENLPSGASISSLEVLPSSVNLSTEFQYAQLLVFGVLNSGERVDVTRMVKSELSQEIVKVEADGLVIPLKAGKAQLKLSLQNASVSIPVEVGKLGSGFTADFVKDVNPVLSKLGCNAGTCHGSLKGKNGFKLSLRGYDPIYDVRSFTDDLASRRVNVASPDQSLMLLKSTGSVPHVGGQLVVQHDRYYEIIRNWVSHGATLNQKSIRVQGISIQPENPVVQRIGEKQQFQIIATYTDGSVRDVTREAFLESGNTEVATATSSGLLTAIRRGEAPILARYEGAYIATTLTVMGNRDGFEWKEPARNNHLDALTAAKWKRLKIQPSELAGDTEFLRRVYLDLTGLPPTVEQLQKFVADTRDTKIKREEVINKLIGSPDFVDYWTNKWADLLQVNRKFLGPQGAAAFRTWIRNEVEQNTPYDQFVKKILTASGSNKTNPPASYYKILRTPEDTMENTTQLFLAIRFNCNKCHDHPFERWTQDQYYETAAYFARVELKRDPASGKSNLAGTAVERAKPLYEIVSDGSKGEVIHERTKEVAPPEFPYSCEFPDREAETRREQLASWMTAADNPYFAKSYVNRLWGYLFGVGIIEPIDDIRAGNPPSNPELLDYLTEQFIESGFDTRHILKLITQSRTYQLSVGTNRWNSDDKVNYSHATARRLPAEVLFDAVHRVTGSVTNFPGVPAGTRAAALPDSGVELPSGFLNKFGRPARESSCECERSSGLQLGPVMALISGPTIANAIADPKNELHKLAQEKTAESELINKLFLRIVNRPATAEEIQSTVDYMGRIDEDHVRLTVLLAESEKKFAAIRNDKEAKRKADLTATTAKLDAYQKSIAAKVAAAEKARLELIAQRTKELQEATKKVDERAAAWEKSHASQINWVPLKAESLKSSMGAKLTAMPDFSIYSEGKTAKGTYTIVMHTELENITGIRLEALTDKRLPKNGPGRAPNDGNFVISELEIKAAPKSDPKKEQKIALQNALADFSQQNYQVAKAIDGNTAASEGWAIAPRMGTLHWSTFETKQPLGFKGGTILTITMHQNYSGNNWLLGRFRLSVTTDKRPIKLSLPQVFATLFATPLEQRTAEQKQPLNQYLSSNDPELIKRKAALAEASKPVPVDPKVTELKARIASLSKPTPEDSRIIQLRADVEMSKKQVANKRLTIAQDLAWALINSPAFLFNH